MKVKIQKRKKLKNKMKPILAFFLLISINCLGQQKELSLNEFLGYVKKYHPVVKQANLKISAAQAELMQARGNFDPKIEVDFDQKEFKDKNYYQLFNGSFKIPTWYGVEIKAAFDNNEGIYMNPENTTPNSGLTSVGISVPLGQGLWINNRMADVKKAKLAQTLNMAERDLIALDVLMEAASSYLNWKQNYEEVKLYENYLKNAQNRFTGILQLIEQGDKPRIDSTEAGILVTNRNLNLEESKLKLLKSKLELSNYLWTSDNIPLELGDAIYPESDIKSTVQAILDENNLASNIVENHPKIRSLQTKKSILEVEQRVKQNNLLPKIDLSYNYLSEPSYFNNYRFQDYKLGVSFSMPLFLRKERAGVKLAALKIQDTEFSLALEKLQLNNKISAQKQEIASLDKQVKLHQKLVTDFDTMLQAEERLFTIGESSIFLINTRENALVSSQIAKINAENRYFKSVFNLQRTTGKIAF